MNPLTFIILLNWNGWKDTVGCIESCQHLTYANFRILIVDNGSTDGSESTLRAAFPDVAFLQTGKNLGFAGGNNAGIRYALEHGADYVWLLNNDTTVEPEALSALVQAAEGDEKIGMVGSKIYFFDRPDLLWYAGAELDPAKPYRLRHVGMLQKDDGRYDVSCETGFVTGCSLLVKRETMEQVGLLDDDLFLYFEDADWNVRARSAGWKVQYCPASVVYHKVSVSMGGVQSPGLYYYAARNLLFFVRRNFPERFAAAFAFAVYEHVLVNLKKGRFPHARQALRGITHFLRDRMGPGR